jgi:PAS domain S-box-containing protein
MTPLVDYLDIMGIVGAAIAVPVAIWRKLVIPINKVFSTNEEVVAAIKQIKSEVVTNGGKSIKDTVNGLKNICEGMEKRQKVIDQRIRASLHYLDAGLFETDRKGKLIWTNEAFCKITGMSQSDMEGYDWLSFIHESERDQVIREFSSCLKMSRKFYVETQTVKDKAIALSGHAYKLGEDQNGGYLINIIQL